MKILFPLAGLYAQLMRLRACFYRRGIFKSEVLPGYVISVGNLELGGTGKSPVVMAICQALQASGAKPAILTRGYKSGLAPDDSAVLQGSDLLLKPRHGKRFYADEAQMQAFKLGSVPVIIGARRFLAAKRYLTHFPAPTHWILDDGFQHLQIARQFNILLLDGRKPFADHRTLPAGRLREDPRALMRADLILLTRCESEDLSQKDKAILTHEQIPVSRLAFHDGPPQQVGGSPYDWNAETRWGLALAIARPDRILQSLEARGMRIRETLIYRDHQRIAAEDLDSLKVKTDAIVTTEKDYHRERDRFDTLGHPIFILPLELQWHDATLLEHLTSRFCGSKLT